MTHFQAQGWMKKAGRDVLDFLLPPRCPACSEKIELHGHLCAACWSHLDTISVPYCARCALPFEVDAGDDAECATCLKDPPAYDWARAAVRYENLGRDLVLGLKHGNQGAGVPVLARMMAGALAGRKTDLILPVPLHRWRLLKRRFNQSQLLASALSKKLGVPNNPFILQRVRSTPSQGTLDRKDRQKNVKGAFRVAAGAEGEIEGKRVLLVDDVLTTGATVGACADVLRKAGAREVGVLVFARVGHPAH